VHRGRRVRSMATRGGTVVTVGAAETLRERICAAIALEHVTELTQHLVSVRTVTGEEAALAEVLAAELARGGCEVQAREFADGRPNIFGRRPGRIGAPRVLLAGHTDTVNVARWERAWPGDRRADPFAATIVGDDLYGRGSADQKGGIAGILAALHALERLGLEPACDLTVAFVGDEESGEPGTGLSAGVRQYGEMVRNAELPTPDFAIYTEPTNLRIYTCQPGFMIGEVIVTGSSSYFAYPSLGRDALRAAHTILGALYEYAERVAAAGEHPQIGRAVMLVTGVRGGEGVAVPGRCSIEFIRTVLPCESMDEVGDEIRATVAAAPLGRDVTAEVAFTASRDHVLGGSPSESGRGAPEVESLAAALALAGGTPTIAGAPYWSEMSILDDLGARAVYFGPGDIATAHTPLESVPLPEVLLAAHALALFLAMPLALRGAAHSES
jgi:acetylornithine deacetylase